MLAANAVRSVASALPEPFGAQTALPFGLAVPLLPTPVPAELPELDPTAEAWLLGFADADAWAHGCSASMRLTAHSRKRRLPSRRSALQIENCSFCRMPSSINLSRTTGGTYMTRSPVSEYIT